ncbi:hypothetical protein D3C77_638580 [compost metagenome]
MRVDISRHNNRLYLALMIKEAVIGKLDWVIATADDIQELLLDGLRHDSAHTQLVRIPLSLHLKLKAPYPRGGCYRCTG